MPFEKEGTNNFWLQIINFFRYNALALIPPSHQGALKLYLCDYGAAVEGKISSLPKAFTNIKIYTFFFASKKGKPYR